MKKLLTILLALLVVTGVVFAADDDATLELKATKAAVHGVVVGLSTVEEPTTMAIWESSFGTETTTANVVQSLEFSDSHLTDSSAAVFAYSNSIGSPTIKITASRLKLNSGTEEAPVNHFINYTVSYGASLSMDVTSDNKEIELATLSVTNGVTFIKAPFTISIIDTSWAAATEGEYKTDWAINLVAP